jgi:toxin CcdB
MAQFDVHRNTGALRASTPFVVVVQSAQFDNYRRRMVVPLVLCSVLGPGLSGVGERLNPVFTVKGVEVVLHTLDMVSLDVEQLGDYVGSLAEQGPSIAHALEELLGRAWG